MDLLIDDWEKVIPTEVKAAENFRVKVWRCTEKNMIRLFASERLWQITETKITDLCIFLFTVITNWIWCDIKNCWKFPKWQGVKKLTSAGGRKQRFYISFRYLKSAWRWNLPTPFFIFKISALTKIIIFKILE